MKRATLTNQTTAAVEQLLLSLEMNEMCVIETIFGTITVQRIYHGAEAWLASDLIPQKELGVRCQTPLQAFTHQLETGKRYAADSSVETDEVTIEQGIVAAMTPLAYSLIFSAALKFSARLQAVQIISSNFDKTLFATKTSGVLHQQTLYYPADSDSVFGACDCLRFRNTLKPCEHLALIACENLFAGAFNSAEVAA